jgi:hypothetical protein
MEAKNRRFQFRDFYYYRASYMCYISEIHLVVSHLFLKG